MGENLLEKTVDELIMTNSACKEEKHFCPICKRFVPKMRIFILNKEKFVQPICKCEADAFDKERRLLEERERRKKIEEKFSISSLGKRFAECRFENFKKRPGTEKSFKTSLDYAKSFNKETEYGLLFWGKPGNGKTHLSASIAHYVKAKGHTVVFQTIVELMSRIKNTFNKFNEETEQGIMTALIDCDLLVLDDLGAEKSSDWVAEKMFEIVERRYRNRKPTVFTTNYSPNELINRLGGGMQGERLLDRIIGSNIILKNDASSFRLEMAQRNLRVGV